jgi:hypothetical protein
MSQIRNKVLMKNLEAIKGKLSKDSLQKDNTKRTAI